MNIRIYPDPVLREKAKEIKEFDTEHLDYIITAMQEVIKKHDAVGLAANQIGIMEQLIVINVGNGSTAIINPEIITKDGEEQQEEGCLSLPGVEFEMLHPKFMLVKGFDKYGEPQNIEATGLLAKVLEHEIDHLNGILIIDKLSPSERLDFEIKWKRGDYEKKAPSRVL